MVSRTLTVPLAVAFLAACQSKPAPVPAASAEPAGAAVCASAAPSPAAAAEATLDGMDAREAVPLIPMMADHQKQNMRDHLLAVQQIIAAAGTRDFAAIEQAASRIGYSEQMGMMCRHMGAGAPGFTDAALAFHHTADGIAVAARKKDLDGVMKALGSTLQTCTNCHKKYKQRVVDEATWTSLTKQAPPMSPMHGQ